MTAETTRLALTAAHTDDRLTTESPQRVSTLDMAAMLVVALVAAAASYGHMYEVATVAGENEWIARLFPITVDGLVLIALRRGREGRWWLALGIAVSVAANVAAAEATIEGRLVAAWPPLALLGVHRLIHGRRPSLGSAAGAPAQSGGRAPATRGQSMPPQMRRATEKVTQRGTPARRRGERNGDINGKRRASLDDVATVSAHLRAEGLPVNRTVVTRRLRAQGFSLANDRADQYLAQLTDTIEEPLLAASTPMPA